MVDSERQSTTTDDKRTPGTEQTATPPCGSLRSAWRLKFEAQFEIETRSTTMCFLSQFQTVMCDDGDI
jgi:hypothetical protein